jgi:phage terminase Nu1 subunit (DNA packaging protein)
MALIGMSEASRILGLTSRGTLYRKVKSGELASVQGANGAPMVERDGLAERWAAIVREKGRHASKEDDEESNKKHRPRPTATKAGSVNEYVESLDYNHERALLTRAQRIKVELETQEKAGELVYKEDMERAYSAVLLQLTTRGLAVTKLIKTDIPELSDKQLEKIERRLADVFNDAAEHEYEELEES